MSARTLYQLVGSSLAGSVITLQRELPLVLVALFFRTASIVVSPFPGNKKALLVPEGRGFGSV
jgi:hypothetical protein